jgi:ParB family transcriptional regulator, chromosome partitioning protein
MSQQQKHTSVPHRSHHDHRRRPHRPHPSTGQKAQGAGNATSQHQSPAPNHQPSPLHVRLIPWEQIVPNPHQPRKHYDEEALQELAESISQHGILQPLLVRQRGNERFELIAGERRHRAAKIAGLTHVPVLIQKANDQEQAEISLIENLQREDLSPVETARAFRTLMREFGLTQQQIGESVGKTQSGIAHVLRLLSLPEELLDSLNRGEIQEGHARVLLRIEDRARQRQLWQQVIAERLSVRKTEQLARGEQVGEAEPAQTEFDRTRLAQMNTQTLQELMIRKFASDVIIQREYERGGRIEFGFKENDALFGFMERLLNTSG